MSERYGWVEEVTGLDVVEEVEDAPWSPYTNGRGFVLSDGTRHFEDGNLIARLQQHGYSPPWPWPRGCGHGCPGYPSSFCPDVGYHDDEEEES